LPGPGAVAPGPLSSQQDGANLPAPEVIAAEIVEDLRAALEDFELLSLDLARGSRPLSGA
jgi:type I restriction enzyme M protein